MPTRFNLSTALSVAKSINFNGVMKRSGYYLYPFYAKDEHIKNIHIVGDANFGNAMIKVANAVCLAKYSGITAISHEIQSFFPNVFTLDNIRITRKNSSTGSLVGEFFNRVSFIEEEMFSSFSNAVEEIASVYLNQDVGNWTSKHKVSNEKSLVIHLRSGDVFNRSNPHPLYGQPPLKFYEAILDKDSYDTLIVVAECEANPVLAALKEIALQRKLDFIFSLNSLFDDLQLIRCCKNIAVSRGTFCPPSILSGKIKSNIYIYDYYGPQWVLGQDEIDYWGLTRKSKRISRLVDLDNDYTASVTNAWKNSSSQRNKLLTRNAFDFTWR